MKAICLAILTITIMTFDSQRTFSQTTDSTSSSSASGCALQFQLIGGVGIYYIGELNQSSYFRVGADVSLNHSDQSGDETTQYLYSSSSSSPTSDTTLSKPVQTTNSYKISISGLYIQKLAEYKTTFLYCGAGPLLIYSWDRGTSNSPSTEISEGAAYTEGYTYENTSKTSGIGPAAIFGVRSRLVDKVGLSAEVVLSAIYQWNTQTNSSSSTSSSVSYTSADNSSGISHLNGWAVSVANVRVGVVIEL